MKTNFLTICLVFALFAVCITTIDAQEALLGHSTDSSAMQLALEKSIRDEVKAENFSQYSRSVAGHLNMAGTPGSRQNAEYLQEYYEDLGFDSRIYSYHVLLPHPVETYLIVHGTKEKVLRPGETGVSADPYSLHSITPFNAYSANSTVRGEVVYVNYGLPEDFEELESRNIDLGGKIALCRFGGTFRGSKVTEAERHGMAGIILYTDPANDGYVRGDVYPDGRMRPADALQRGSIINMVASPGDPLTPLIPAVKDTERISMKDAALPKIPCIPLSYEHALELFEGIKGEDVPQKWQGGLPLRYHIGPGPVEVTLHAESDFQIREIWDTIAILPGSEEPDSWVLIGCHRDAWLYGAQDPHSGTIVLMEAARAISNQIRKTGPMRRSLVFCSWDAEEFGILGSIEFVEQFRDDLYAKAVAYMNADAMISGSSFWAASSPTLRKMFDQVIRTVKNTEGKTLYQSWFEKQPAETDDSEQYPFGMFGGGSDHTGFLHHVSIPCLAAGLGGATGIYHSAYDTIAFMERYGDPGYLSHAVGSKLVATVLTRLANSPVVPIDPSAYVKELKQLWADFEKDYEEIAPELTNAYNEKVKSIQSKAALFNDLLCKALETDCLSNLVRLKINTELKNLERSFYNEQGLSGRPWYKNLLYSVSLQNGYGRITLPGLRATWEQAHRFKLETDTLLSSMEKYLDKIEILVTALQQ